MTGFITI